MVTVADNPIGPLTALLMGSSTLYSGAGAPTISGIPAAGMGATMAFQQGAVPEDPIPEVYLGQSTTTSEQDTPRGFGSQTHETKSVNTANPDELLAAFAKAPKEEQRRMALLLSMAGYAGSGSLEDSIEDAMSMTLGQTVEAYQNLLSDAVQAYVLDGRKITPEQLLRKAIAYRMPAGVEWDGDLDSLDSVLGIGGKDGETEEEAPFTGTKSITSTSINRDIMDPADAKALTRAMLQRELGRDPTNDEFEDFIGAIQYAQRVNPDRTTTTQSSTFEDDELVSQRTVSNTRQGISSEGIADLAMQKARQNPGWAEWQAIGTYAPALFEALGATVPGR